MKALRVGVVGGSIGGLTAGALLHEMGCDVHVFERSTAALEGRGAGIVVLPMTERYFTQAGTGLSGPSRDVALTLTYWSYIDRSGAIIDAAATHNRFTSWNTAHSIAGRACRFRRRGHSQPLHLMEHPLSGPARASAS